MWGMGIGGISGIFLSIYQLFRGNSFITGATPLSPLWFFLIGIDAVIVSVSTYLIYYRDLTDKGLFRAGVTLRVGYMLLGPICLLLFRPWGYVTRGVMTSLECTVISVAIMAFSLGLWGVSLIRLVRGYRQGEQPEKEQKAEDKTPKKVMKELAFWGFGLLFGLLLLFNLGVEHRYQTVKAEYEDLRRQSVEVTMGQRQEKDFDRERYDEIYAQYQEIHRLTQTGKHNTRRGLLESGSLLLIWIFVLLGRIISRAAWRSVEKDEKMARKRALRESNKDPWDRGKRP